MKTLKSTTEKTSASTLRTCKKYSYFYTITPYSLNIKTQLTLIQGGKIVSRSISEEKNFPLKKISSDELFNLRMDFTHAGFILKIKNSLYYSRIPKNVKFLSQSFCIEGFDDAQTCIHICGQNCKRLSAAQDCDGGCAKIRDIPLSSLSSGWCDNVHDCVDVSERIEKYNFVRFGFESFNTQADTTYILLCKNYRLAKNKSKSY